MLANLWKNEYTLELDDIDKQHKKFLGLCGEVLQLGSKANASRETVNEIIRALGAMRTYAFLHFKTEEELMLKHNFPGYLEHTGYHNNYLQRMMEFESGFKAVLVDMGKSEDDGTMLKMFLSEMGKFIADWWGAHIVSQDAKYARHIKEKRQGSLA